MLWLFSRTLEPTSKWTNNREWFTKSVQKLSLNTNIYLLREYHDVFFVLLLHAPNRGFEAPQTENKNRQNLCLKEVEVERIFFPEWKFEVKIKSPFYVENKCIQIVNSYFSYIWHAINKTLFILIHLIHIVNLWSTCVEVYAEYNLFPGFRVLDYSCY